MHDLSNFYGLFCPMVTPITTDESPDLDSLPRLVEYLLSNGVHGLWVLGTTGEFPCFTPSEREAVVRATVEATHGRVPVVANVSDCSTRSALEHARRAARAGADAIACTPPYYYPNSQDELLEHYRALHDEAGLPLLVYNIPQTVKVRVEVPTVLRLAEEGAIVGIKDSQNDLVAFREMVVGAQQHGLDLRAFLGTRVLIDAAASVGAVGVIPASSNLAPRLFASAWYAAERGDIAEARRLSEECLKVERLAGVARGGSSNAATIAMLKAGLHHLGVLRFPMVCRPLRSLAVEERERLATLMAECGLV